MADTGPAAKHAPRLERLALASFIVSLLICPLGPIASVLAIIIGHAALRGIRRNPEPVAGKLYAVSGLAIGYTTAVLFLLVLASAVPQAHALIEKNLNSGCRRQLELLSLRIHEYRAEHDGTYPPSLSALYPDYVSDLVTFTCPASDDKPGDPADIDDWSSYRYAPPLPDEDTPNVPILQERRPYHPHGGRNRAYPDARVETIPAP